MNNALHDRLTQFHRTYQQELLPLVEADMGASLSPMMQRLLRIWEYAPTAWTPRPQT